MIRDATKGRTSKAKAKDLAQRPSVNVLAELKE